MFFSCLTAIFLGVWLNFLLTPLASPPEGMRYRLQAGASLKTVVDDLSQQGILKHPFLFYCLARLRGDTQELKAGVYLIRQGTTPGRFLKQLTSGSGLFYHAFTIVPGWTFEQLRAALMQAPELQHLIETKSNDEIRKTLAITTGSLEGEFFPDTYYYTEDSSDLRILKRAYKRMHLLSQSAWQNRSGGLPFKTVNEALIAASMVEKEAHLGFERPVIAGVLVNRLQKRMLLQFDPTVIYGLNEWARSHPKANFSFNGTLQKKDLQLDTAYNTYLHRGLPPTAIAMPGMDAIQAVLHPTQHAYLYFVATGGGGHQFSKTLSEHHLAVMMQQYYKQGFFNFIFIKNYLFRRLLQEKT